MYDCLSFTNYRMSKMILISIEDNANDRMIKTMNKNGFKSKKAWIRWAINQQLQISERALKRIEGTAIDESGVPSIPHYVEKKEVEFVFIMHDGTEQRAHGKDMDEAMKSINIDYEDVLSWL